MGVVVLVDQGVEGGHNYIHINIYKIRDNCLEKWEWSLI